MPEVTREPEPAVPADAASRPATPPVGELVSLVLAAVVVGWFAIRAWQWRWMTDDGIIVQRTVRNLLAGNGPVFNAGERVETNTSTLWTLVVAAAGLVTDDLDTASMLPGVVLSVLGLAGMLAGAVVLRGRAPGRWWLPVGVAVYCALTAARDFATSGLENGLVLCWVGATWYALCRVAAGHRDGGHAGARGVSLAGVVVGLGWLVRPELAVVTALGLAWLLVVTPGWAARARLAAAALAAPAAYQVFRMGYYGLTVPHTAMAKEAGVDRTAQGLHYWDLSLRVVQVGFFRIAVVLLVVGLLVTAALRVTGWRTPGSAGATRPALGSLLVSWGPVLVVLASGVVLVAYSVHNGGDYMRGRMTLLPLALLLCPLAADPVDLAGATAPGLGSARSLAHLATAPGAVLVVLWSFTAVAGMAPRDLGDTTEDKGIVDERAYKVAFTGTGNPDSAEVYARVEEAPQLVVELGRAGPGTALLAHRDNRTWAVVSPTAGAQGPTTVVAHHLGIDAALAPLDVRVWDYVGLATPLAGHVTGIPGGRVGHDKDLPFAWVVAPCPHRSRTVWTRGPSRRRGRLCAARRSVTCSTARPHRSQSGDTSPTWSGQSATRAPGSRPTPGRRRRRAADGSGRLPLLDQAPAW